VEVPADADFIIEGYVDPADEAIWEGPFGDHTGYYSLPDWYPRFHITCITHKKNAVYPATIVGIPPQEDAWLGKATERIFLAPMKMTMVPEIMDMDMPVEGVFHNLVIAQIKKEYAGQGQKVMNAMWGAGQMMFNKILVLADQHIKIQDYKGLAQYVLANLDPASDIYFSQGPMDVLDHSCSKLGFGGKMCIDGTRKFNEEREEELAICNWQFAKECLNDFSEIKKINSSLLKENIPVLIVSVEKNRKGHVRELHQQICKQKEIEGMKLILYVEHTVDANDLATALWRFCNNLDPKRDHILFKGQRTGNKEQETRDKEQETTNYQLPTTNFSCMGLDGTRKTKELDNFHRDWPNIIVADEATIKSVDEKWNRLGLGEFLPSPSLKFKSQLYGEEAVVSN
jgi:4-hydroxy-3-polyprenylbenzoate decarboxylase